MIISRPASNHNATTRSPRRRRPAQAIRHAVCGVAALATVAAIAGGSAQAGSRSAGPTGLRHNGRIVFQAVVGKTTQLFTISPDGAGLEQVTHVAVRDDGPENPTWAPDGSTIAFDWQYRQGVSIYTSSPGRSPRLLPLSVGAYNADPAYSPDGRQIAFEQEIGPSHPKINGIFIAHADGSDARRLTTGIRNSHSYDTEPDWSPDGRRLAFTRIKSNKLAAVFVVNVSGTSLRRLTPWTLDAASPRWSPDGSMILFSSYWDAQPGKSANIYSIRPDGADRTALTHVSGPVQVFRPCWSPDGTKILFSRFVFTKKRTTSDLYTMNPNGTDFQRVTHMPSAYPNQADWGSAR